MKTLSKKILTGCMALAMAVAMAVPAFAATPAVASSPVGRTVGIHGYGNILAGALTANGAYNQAPVDLQQFKDKAGQKWNIEGNGNYGTIYTAQTVTGSRLAINLYRTAVSSGVYPVTLATTGGNVDDTYFYFPTMMVTPSAHGCSKAVTWVSGCTSTRAIAARYTATFTS